MVVLSVKKKEIENEKEKEKKEEKSAEDRLLAAWDKLENRLEKKGKLHLFEPNEELV